MIQLEVKYLLLSYIYNKYTGSWDLSLIERNIQNTF